MIFKTTYFIVQNKKKTIKNIKKKKVTIKRNEYHK